MPHRTADELEAGLAAIRCAPRDAGTIELITYRPAPAERAVVDEAVLDTALGLVGDSWSTRPNRKEPGAPPNPETQITLMGARVIALIADDWALAGDQLYVDLDLSQDHVPPGTRLAIGDAIIEVTAPPHTGCAKFTARFGSDVMRWVNSPTGRALNLRGVHGRIVAGGPVRRGDVIRKLG